MSAEIEKRLDDLQRRLEPVMKATSDARLWTGKDVQSQVIHNLALAFLQYYWHLVTLIENPEVLPGRSDTPVG